MSTSSSAPASARRRVEGAAELARALDAGLPVRCVVVPEGPLPPELAALCHRAADAGAEIVRSAERRHARLAGDLPVAALIGPERDADLDAVMARGGAVWLIVGARYAGNVGTAIRTAEVSGADGVYIDNSFDHDQRREARRASMRADRFLPVAWERAGDVIGAARRAGKRIVGVESSGTAAPWELDLRPPLLLVAGGESDGIPRALLARCDVVTRIPMAGFVASYNLQAAVAIVAAERLRQRGGSR
jgi:23S rRNA (guanosine2251-2'-O)-methyltransferase